MVARVALGVLIGLILFAGVLFAVAVIDASGEGEGPSGPVATTTLGTEP